MISILQGNMHRSKTANDLLNHRVLEEEIDLLILSEQYHNRDTTTWIMDNLGTAAIWVRNTRKLPIENRGSENGYVWVKSKGVTYVSCYFTPKESLEDFQEKLDLLEDTIQEAEGAVIVAGDLNARAIEWGMPRTDTRGKRIMDMSSRRGLLVMNAGNTKTFRRFGNAGTIPDITLASEGIAPLIEKWKVLEDYTGSDHQYISYNIRGSLTRKIYHNKTKRWNVAKLDAEKLSLSIIRGQNSLLKEAGMEIGRAHV